MGGHVGGCGASEVLPGFGYLIWVFRGRVQGVRVMLMVGPGVVYRC